MRSIFFSIIVMPKKSHFIFSQYKTLFKTRIKTREFHLNCWDHVCKVNEWCLVYCFYRKFRVSTRTMVRDYCIAKWKTFSTCGGHLMAHWAIFFVIQNIYINSNPAKHHHFKKVSRYKFQFHTIPIIGDTWRCTVFCSVLVPCP